MPARRCSVVSAFMKVFLLFAPIALAAPASAWATAQFTDKLIYNGKTLYIFSNPLESYFDSAHPRPDDLFPPACTACWRGYIATWKIEKKRLYLVALNDCTQKRNNIPLSKIFPGRKPPIKADWFTGTLTVPEGKLLQYVHMGYGSIFEREIHLRIEKGALVESYVVDNTKRNLSEERRVIEESMKPPKDLKDTERSGP